MPRATIAMQPPSLLSGLLWGVGMGAGSELGHGAVRALTGGNRPAPAHEEAKVPGMMGEEQKGSAQDMNHPCAAATLEFLNCLRMNSGDIGMCQNLYSSLTECQLKFGTPGSGSSANPPNFCINTIA
eukprot:TRINITY_DN2699_c0_g1_i10.p2 TRINITY_DN2699_c0_g1~~TRINITY_DN2699_c0_g1_i10.p2  ORF type:complete len:127 (-),score=8.45 TRINITY_DN2699_c0_g1_i10:132-512(-)